MAKIDVDITKTEDMFEKLNKQVKRYTENVDSFFMSIMSNIAWKGPSSERYKSVINKEKSAYYSFGDAMSKFIDNSKSSVDDLKTTISNNSME